MASVQDLKRRTRSVRNTSKITKALELVASARLRRAQSRIEAMRPYAETMRELIAGVGRSASSLRGLPLLQQREEVETVGIVVLTGDRGLAGPFNGQVLRRAFALERELRGEGKQVRFVVVGKKGRTTLEFRGYETAADYAGFADRPAYSDAQAIAHGIAELYTDGTLDQVVLIYNAFVSALTQRVTEQELLPISADILETDEDERRDDAMRGDFIFEPEPEEILARLLPVYLETQVYRALLESAASFQGAQMTAMRNASKNAGELIDSLTLQMNRARQAEITQEILEVVAEAPRRWPQTVAPAASRVPVDEPNRSSKLPIVASEKKQSDLMSSGAGLATAVALESHGELGEIQAVKARGYWEQVWLRFRRDKVAIAGGVFVIVLIIVAFIGAPIAQRILGHGPNEIFAGRARSRLAASGRTADVDHDGAISRRGRQLRGHVLRARRRFAARPGHVPTVALRRPDLVAGGRARDVPLRLHRARDGPDGGLLPWARWTRSSPG